LEFESARSDSPGASDLLAGMTVGIYTLARGVGERVARLLKDSHPGVQVRVNSDKVGTDRLKHLAVGSDVMLVAVRCAKHAATNFINLHRPKDLPTLQARGKGSSSLIAALAAFLESKGTGLAA
jgi:hypothetical protein